MLWIYSTRDLINLLCMLAFFACILVPVISIIRTVLLKNKPPLRRK